VATRTAAGLAAVFLVTLAGAPAMADNTPTANPGPSSSAAPRNIGPATPGTTVCTVNNNALDEITGMVVKDGNVLAVESGATQQPAAVEVWKIGLTNCPATKTNYTGNNVYPVDPQDLALGSNGTDLWVGDLGNGVNGGRTGKVALERVDLSKGGAPEINRISYPSSGQINGKALLFEADGTPLIIANAGSKGAVYKPNGPLVPNAQNGYPTLTKVGDFTPIKTGTPSDKPGIAYLFVTGAAISPDRTHVVIRTSSDAYEYEIPSGATIADTITNPEAPRAITPLPNDGGEAITYSADGTQFLTLSAGKNPVLRSYKPFVVPADTPANAPAGDSGGGKLSLGDITNIAAVIGFLGLVAVVAGIVGIVRFRKQSSARLADGDWGEGDHDDEYASAGAQRRPPRQGGRRGDGSGGYGGRSRGGGGGRPGYDDDYGRQPYPQGPQGPMQGQPPQAPPQQGPGWSGGGRPQPQSSGGGVYGKPRGGGGGAGGTVYGGRGDQAGGYGQENIDL
jgi:hypothetical protein